MEHVLLKLLADWERLGCPIRPEFQERIFIVHPEAYARYRWACGWKKAPRGWVCQMCGEVAHEGACPERDRPGFIDCEC